MTSLRAAVQQHLKVGWNGEKPDAQIMTGVAEASLPTSSSSCMIFLIRA